MEMLVLSAEECRPLRATAGRTTKFKGDDDPGAMHLAFKEGDELLSAASILPERREGRHEMWRLRGFVVAAGHRRQGHGKRLMTAVQMIVSERGGGLWCRARADAQPFLEACGFSPLGDARAARAASAASGTPAAPAASTSSARVVMTWDG